ncbi:MAG: tetratricopeptide repeat protein [Desulfobulbaceae bacterium]|nr:tetratricopeptide repeat protein [Desulfobulbaceae bacterium]
MTAKTWNTEKQREFIGILLLLMVPLLVFLQVGWHDFLGYDDPINIYQNPRVTTFSVANLLYFWQGPSLGLYIPLTYNFWMLLAKLSQLLTPGGSGEPMAPQLFHLTNLLVHLGGTTLVFMILRNLLNNARAAAVGALLFAIHPVQVEPVAWASGMKDLLSGFWSLLAIWQYIRFCRAPEKSGRIGHYLLAILSLALALLAKPAAVIVPLLAGLVGRLVLERPWRLVLSELSPWLLCVAPVVAVTALAQPASAHIYQPPIWQRFLVAGDAISFYLWQLFLPLNLGPDYGRLPEWVLNHNWVYLTGTAPYALAGIMIWKASRWWLAGVGLFIAALLPVLGLQPFAFQEVSTVADRYLYLAMLGPALAVALTWSQYQWQKTCQLLVLVFLALLTVKSTIQTKYWKNSFIFSTHAIQINPQSWNSYLRYGIAEYLANHRTEAIAAFNKALAIKPDFVDAHYSLGVVAWDQGRTDQALAFFNQALALDPTNVPTALGLGDIYRKSGRPSQAIRYYQIAVGSELDRAEYHVNLGVCNAEVGEEEAAIANFLKAIAMQPDYPEAHYRLRALYQKRQEYGKATAILQNLPKQP